MTRERRGAGVGDYERWWGATADDDRVWTPGGDPGNLRFTPTGEPRREEPLPPVVPVAPAGAAGSGAGPAARVIAIAVAVAVLSVFVGAQVGMHFRRHAAVRPVFGAP